MGSSTPAGRAEQSLPASPSERGRARDLLSEVGGHLPRAEAEPSGRHLGQETEPAPRWSRGRALRSRETSAWSGKGKEAGG